MKIISQPNFKEASFILKRGGIVAFPTETVFGLGVVYDNEKSYERLIKVKRRSPDKPFTLMCADPENISHYAEVDERARKLIKAFMPGQFTLVLKARLEVPYWVVSNDGYVGVRVPNHKLARDLIRFVGKPLLVPSANVSGEKPYTDSYDVYSGFEGEIDAVIDGLSESNVPSTVVVLGNKVEVVREGLITKEMITKALEAE